VEGIDKKLAASIPIQAKMGNVLYSKVIQKHGEGARRKMLAFSAQYEQKYYLGFIPNQPLVDFVKQNASYYGFSIWSSNNRKTIERVLQELALSRLFPKIAAKEDVILLKPELDGFNLIFDSVAQRKEDYLMVGDNFLDEGAAKNAGIDYFQVAQDWREA
jgi:FMN phosphatase YigB (HAD superfamily)